MKRKRENCFVLLEMSRVRTVSRGNKDSRECLSWAIPPHASPCARRDRSVLPAIAKWGSGGVRDPQPGLVPSRLPPTPNAASVAPSARAKAKAEERAPVARARERQRERRRRVLDPLLLVESFAGASQGAGSSLDRTGGSITTNNPFYVYVNESSRPYAPLPLPLPRAPHPGGGPPRPPRPPREGCIDDGPLGTPVQGKKY